MSMEAFTIEAHRSSVSLRSVDNGCQILCVAISSAHSTSLIVFENICSCSCSHAVCGPKLAYAFFCQKFKQVSVWSVQSIDSLAYVSPRGIYLKPLNRRTRRRVRVLFPYKHCLLSVSDQCSATLPTRLHIFTSPNLVRVEGMEIRCLWPVLAFRRFIAVAVTRRPRLQHISHERAQSKISYLSFVSSSHKVYGGGL